MLPQIHDAFLMHRIKLYYTFIHKLSISISGYSEEYYKMYYVYNNNNIRWESIIRVVYNTGEKE